MLRKYCHETGKCWGEGVPFVLFAIRVAKQESLGFSSAELVFGHNVQGLLNMLMEKFKLESEKSNVLDFSPTVESIYIMPPPWRSKCSPPLKVT